MDDQTDLTASVVDVYYELHIQPLFRPADRLNMLSRFDLWKYEDLVGPVNKEKILRRLRLPREDMGVMPPVNDGGPWPEEWIALLQRWYDSGCKRVEKSLGTYTARRANSIITLTAQGPVPAPNYAVWFDQLPDRTTPYEYVLYEKPEGKFTSRFAIRLRFADPGPALITIIIYDKNGRQSVPIQ